MAYYSQSEVTNLYWASNDGFKGGRDPLGIQNSSIATYSTLLPGLTNLTSHIRYYSLYCWLLSEYDELEKAEETTLHQYDFVRRAELAMALIMKEHYVGAIVGSMFVLQKKYKTLNQGVYDIADGADFYSKEKYWTFKSGALGQYYAGSLIYYELIKVEENRFYLRNQGKFLADAVRNSVNADVRDLYVRCIQNGRLSEDDIKKLQPLAIHNIKVDSAEWNFLNNLLIKSDEVSSLRRETIYLLLNDLSKGVEVNNFAKNRFLRVEESPNIQASFGWYFYFLCEVLHYCIDSMFCIILNEIHDLHNPPTSILSQDIVNSILDCFKKKRSYSSLKEWMENENDKIEVAYEILKENIKNHNYIAAAINAISLLLRLYSEFETNKAKILDFENKNDLSRQRGILSEGLKMYVERYLQFPIPKYIESLVAQIIQEHTVIAIAKMGKSNSDLRKFIFENGHIVLVEQRYPIETSPRINSLNNFLQDLSYLDSDNNLTTIAQSFILDYGKE